MIKNFKLKIKNYSGFTLVELLVVISIMSILTVITVSQFMTARKKARDVARKGDLNGVTKALQMYYADYGRMPAAVDGKISVNGTTGIEWGEEFLDGTYSYMKKLPKENSSGIVEYCYKTDVDRKKYALFAQLENTVDSECEGHTYHCNSQDYCYGVVSPNSTLNAEGELQ